MDRLPTELHLKIAGHLKDIHELNKFTRTCRSIYESIVPLLYERLKADFGYCPCKPGLQFVQENTWSYDRKTDKTVILKGWIGDRLVESFKKYRLSVR